MKASLAGLDTNQPGKTLIDEAVEADVLRSLRQLRKMAGMTARAAHEQESLAGAV